ncbi:ATP-binding protein [Levilactobacillus zymae]|uniref:ATP-binding protein n=1 Tax=Levilactobacillus zymae TaxID=267363 RepID=UPI0028B90E80|nr:ATP-binding protein [Levilactobacillus zymae]MDT6980577.1 ATP-binding protein [Levilactobacillus zymae]
MTWDSSKTEYELTKWFTPSKPATNNYVDRGPLDRTIFREFAQQGRQVLVYGPTGAGKTSMVLDNLEKLKTRYQTKSIRVTMTNTTTVESFIAEVAYKLQLTRMVQSVETKETSVNTSAALKIINWVSANLGGQKKQIQQDIREQYTGPDDFTILEEALFKRNTILVVDDMENLTGTADELRIRLAEIAKNMSDDAVNYEQSYAKIVFVGIATTAEQLWHDVESLKSRLATISVPYLNAHESQKIIQTGWQQAQLSGSIKQVEKTAYIASGIGKVVHELGQKTGYAAVDDGSQVIRDRYTEDAIHEVFEVNELDYEEQLNKAKNKTSTKTTVRNYVLYAMANDDRTKMTIQDILRAVNELRDADDKKANTISPALTQLKSAKFDILSNDRNSWQFKDPMFKAYVREHKDELLLKKND